MAENDLDSGSIEGPFQMDLVGFRGTMLGFHELHNFMGRTPLPYQESRSIAFGFFLGSSDAFMHWSAVSSVSYNASYVSVPSFLCFVKSVSRMASSSSAISFESSVLLDSDVEASCSLDLNMLTYQGSLTSVNPTVEDTDDDSDPEVGLSVSSN